MNRRTFGAVFAAGGLAKPAEGQSTALDGKLRAALARNRIPAAVAMVASENNVLYQGAFGVKIDAIFRIASMTKAITTVAAAFNWSNKANCG